MSDYKVSIIVTAYNKALFLSECLNSVLEQSDPNWECIIVNDGSVDNTEEIVKTFTSKDNRFRYIYQTNSGVSIARNNGIFNSIGNFIVPLDGDDKLHPSFVEKAVNCFENKLNLKLVTCEGEYFGNITGKIILPDIDIKKLPLSNMFFCTGMFRKDDFEKTNGYIADLSGGMEDWLFWIDFIQEGDFVYRIPEVLFYYRTITLSKSDVWRKDDKKKIELLDKIYLRNKDLYVGANNPIVLYREKQVLEEEIIKLKRRFFVRIDIKLRPFIVKLKSFF